MEEIVMRMSWQGAALGAALTAAVGGLAVAGSAANAQTTTAGHAVQQVTTLQDGSEPATVAANEREVRAFLQDVLNEHHGDHAARYMNPGVQWHGGTVGTVSGRAGVAGLFAGVVASLPDVHGAVEDVFGAGSEVVVRQVVSGTQKGALLSIPATGRRITWDAVDIFRLRDGKISQIWAGDDWTAILYYTGTYKAPWIP
jgi:predicted ester cyclase